MPRPTLCVGAAGTSTAWGLVRSARDRWGDALRVVALDIHPAHLVATATLADVFVRAPLSSDPEFPAFLLQTLTAWDVDAYVPLLDAEVALVADLRDAGRLPCRTTAPASSVAMRCLDKLAMARWLEAQGLPTPTTIPLSEAAWRPDWVLKPRCGFGSAGVRVLDAAADLDRARGQAGAEGWLVQQRCDPPEITLDVVALDGVRAVCRERLETRRGVCTKARVFEDAALEGLAARLVAALGLRGPLCLQVMRWDGGWAITDVNARTGGGTRMSVAAGVDVHGALLADALGLPHPGLARLAHERFVTRQYTECVQDPA